MFQYYVDIQSKLNSTVFTYLYLVLLAHEQYTHTNLTRKSLLHHRFVPFAVFNKIQAQTRHPLQLKVIYHTQPHPPFKKEI